MAMPLRASKSLTSSSRSSGLSGVMPGAFKVFCMYTLKLTQSGNSVGAVFSKELLAQLKLDKGDIFYVAESRDGLRHNPVC